MILFLIQIQEKAGAPIGNKVLVMMTIHSSPFLLPFRLIYFQRINNI